MIQTINWNMFFKAFTRSFTVKVLILSIEQTSRFIDWTYLFKNYLMGCPSAHAWQTFQLDTSNAYCTHSDASNIPEHTIIFFRIGFGLFQALSNENDWLTSQSANYSLLTMTFHLISFTCFKVNSPPTRPHSTSLNYISYHTHWSRKGRVPVAQFQIDSRLNSWNSSKLKRRYDLIITVLLFI